MAEHAPSHLLIALGPVNLEGLHEGIGRGLHGDEEYAPWARRGEAADPGYPAMTATVVNLPLPVVTYANWFSYVTADFEPES